MSEIESLSDSPSASGDQLAAAAGPALFRHAINMYEFLEKTALRDSEGNLIWQGSLVSVVRDELHLSMPYYTKIVRTLKRMGCLEQVQRGGGGQPSTWRLITPPSQERLQEFGVEPWDANQEKSVVLSEQATLDVLKRLGTLEETVEGLVVAEYERQQREKISGQNN